MEIGIIGLPVSGKSTIFSTLTEQEIDPYSGKMDSHQGIVKVPDTRLDQLTSIFNPKKQVNATINYVEVPGLEKDAGKSGFNAKFLTNLKNTDAIIVVIRAFENEMAPHPEGSINPKRDIETIDSELLFSDLSIIENRLERLKKQIIKQKTPEAVKEMELLEKCRDTLENEQPIRALSLSEEEFRLLRGYQFLTLKPVIYALNVNENDLAQMEDIEKHYGWAREKPKSGLVILSAQIEKELSQLDKEEMAEFMADLGIQEAALPRLIRASYQLLGLISFFTVGEDECRAWTIRENTHAQKAAGVIHSDLEKGFIRAEVVHYDTFMKHKSWNKCKETGDLRLEGKDYIVKDGDIISVRFNV